MSEGLTMPTYTSLYGVERRLHKIFDIDLPRPVAISQLVVFVVSLIADVVILNVVGYHPPASMLFIYVLPPGLIAWFSNHDFCEGQRALPWASAQLRHLLVEPRELQRLQRCVEPASYLLRLELRRVGGS